MAGLRIAVNQWERVHGFEVNTHCQVESYESFAEQLQKEIEEETGIKFGGLKSICCKHCSSTGEHTTSYLGTEASAQLYNHLKAKGYIDTRGKVQDALDLT